MKRRFPGIIEKVLIVLAVCCNFFYLAGALLSWHCWELLLASYVFEAGCMVLCSGNKTLSTVYRDISSHLSLIKGAVFCYFMLGMAAYFSFLLIEIYLIIIFRASVYLDYKASSLPALNFTGAERLQRLFVCTRRLIFLHKALYLRPVVHLLVGAQLLVFIPHYKEVFYLFLLVLTICFLFFAVILLRTFLYLKSSRYRKDIQQHLKNNSPDVIVYVSGAPGSTYQLQQWVPVLQKIPLKITVVARELFWIDEFPDNPLHTVYARGMQDLDNFIGDNTKVCLYPANAYKNTQMMRQTGLRHIFINHGESDKIVNSSRLLGAYTKLYLAGPMARERLENSGIEVRDSQYTYVGRPQTSIFLENGPGPQKTVLYAPTWEGFDSMSNYSSVGKIGVKLVQTLLDTTEYKILFKPHPLTGIVKKSYGKELDTIRRLLEQSGRGTYYADGNILEIMNLCSCMITDISSVMNDFLATLKPYIVINTSGASAEEFQRSFLTARGGYILSKADEITGIISQIETEDPLRSVRQEVKSYSLGDFACSDFEKFSRELQNDCSGS